jgi:tetratricopeptide (TPR) repeat protein
VHACTAGVALFVQDCVRDLILRHGAAALYGLDPTAARLPESARAVLHARLTALAPESLWLLAAASVLGPSVELPLLAAITERRPASLLPPLQAAERAGFLYGDSPQRFRFADALLQALLYDELPGSERVQLHRRAAEALEQSPTLPPRSAEIALHYYRALPAGTHVRAAAAAREAARAAESVLDYARAAHYYEWVLEAEPLSRSHEPRAFAELLLSAGKAQRLAGRTRQSRDTLTQLFELARAQRFTDLLLRGARVLRPSVAVSVMPDPLVRSALEDVLRLASAEDTESGRACRALALSHLACVPPTSFDLPRCKLLSEEALHLARQLGQVPVLLEALRARLHALSGPDDSELLLLTAAEMLELDRPQPSIMTLEAHGARCAAYAYRGELAAADQALAAFGRAAHEQNLLEGIWYYDRQRAQRLLMQGDYAGAGAAIRELYGRSQQLGIGYGRDFLAPLERRLRHDLHRADAALNESRLAQGLTDVIPYLRAQRARFAAERGELAAAKSGVDWLAAQGFENLPREVSYLNTLANLAIAVTRLGDCERAEQLYTLLSPYALLNTPDGYLCDEGAVSRYLALLAATLGWHERVEAHFRSALVVNRDMGRRPELARTYYDYAVWVSNQDQHGASAQAQDLAREASMLAESLGMSWLSQLARELMT